MAKCLKDKNSHLLRIIKLLVILNLRLFIPKLFYLIENNTNMIFKYFRFL